VVLRVMLAISTAGRIVPPNQFLTLLVVQIGQQLFLPHDFSSQINQLWVSGVILMEFTITRSLEDNNLDESAESAGFDFEKN
jgi:ABC-type enterochelin transport system permease subunit